MANRYWVGGAGTWNTSSTTNWSTASGGASGASVPTAADSVFFDQAGTYTVTCTGNLLCLDITVSAGTVTFADGSFPTFTISGSMSLLAGTVWSSTGVITFNSAVAGKTVTTNGTTLNSSTVQFNNSGSWTLGSALTINGGINFVTGTFDTSAVGNYAVTITGIISISGASTRAINFNASTITTSYSTSGALNATIITNLTFNAGTSQINFTGNAPGIISNGLTFYNVAFTSTFATVFARPIVGSNTFNNLSVTGPATAGITNITFDSPQIINGALSTTGTAGTRRVFFSGSTYGISQTLTVNSTASLTDADFRSIYIAGTASPISGTRIGNRGENRGITFSAPKTVYWNLASAQNWSANGWATTSTGTPSTDNFPLPQDTATFTNAGSVTGAITLDAAIGYISSIDMSTRTTGMSMVIGAAQICYGNWTNGSGVTFINNFSVTYSGGTTQTITSAGRTFSWQIIIDTYGGTVQLADALNVGSTTLLVTNGTFNTNGYAVSAGNLSSSNSNVRAINLGASTINLSATVTLGTTTNLTFNAGASTINHAGGGFSGGGLTFYNVTFPNSITTASITGANIFNNLTFTAPAAINLIGCTFAANQTINGTLTCAGASANQRIFLRSDTIGTRRTLTVNTLSAADCDFRDLVIAGTASGSSPTRAGNCGGNTGITFPAAKTVYWNLGGALQQSWSNTGWAATSGGTPAVNNFPLAQDTAVFDNAGAMPSGGNTVPISLAWNIGTINASARTSAGVLQFGNGVIYGNLLLGTGITTAVLGFGNGFTMSGNTTQTITSNGVQFGNDIIVSHPLANVQLADALSLNAANRLTLSQGTFDAVSYNVTAGSFSGNSSWTLKMGSGTWTMTGTGGAWFNGSTTIAGTSTIVLSDTSTTARTFTGGGNYYNKLTIGGATGTSTLTISGNNIFGEIASTKTVAHTIDFGTALQTFGKWSVTGTAGNVVTITGTSTNNVIAGPAVTGVDYLAMGTWGVSTTSPGEFYAGANSTGTATTILRTAAPTPRTLYWRGGTGNWSATTSWDTVSGGTGPAAIPTSLDSVIFDSLSNATAYTATIDAGVTLARCAAFTMAGPLTGNVTWAGIVGIAYHGSVSFAATGITRTYSGTMNWAGNSSYTFTTNGLILGGTTIINGIGSTWTLGSDLNLATTNAFVTYGTFNTSTSNYTITAGSFSSSNSNIRSVLLNASTLTTTQNPINFSVATNLTFNRGTSLITSAGGNFTFSGGSQTFWDVTFTNAATTAINITGTNTFNTLSFAGRTSVGITPVTFSANQIIGALTLNAGTAAVYRTFLASDTIGTPRTLTVTTLTAGAVDYDFRDIAVTGSASPLTGTRFGDCKGNSGITFDTAKTVYYRQTGSNNWGTASAGSWSLTSGGAFDATAFPLAQDTAVFPAATYPASGSTTTIGANYSIGTIDMQLRTTNTMTLALGVTTPTIYGNWINGTGTTISASSGVTFAGRGTQTITSAGKTFTAGVTTDSPGGTVTLQDSFVCTNISSDCSLVKGTFNANGYNVTLSGRYALSGTFTRTVAIGSGTWTIAATSNPWFTSSPSNLTITGTGTLSFTGATAKTFDGGSLSYSGITLNQGGAGALTISGNNTFNNITNTYSATGATSILLDATTQTVNQWTATGAATRVLSLSGTSAASPATLVLSGATNPNVDYLSIANVRAYPL
jgi:hypothetical protein